MIVAANDVRHTEIGIVEDGGKVVRRDTVGAKNDEVIELRVLEDRPALDQIVNHRDALVRRAKADGVVAASLFVGKLNLRQVSGQCAIAAAAIVAGLAM